MNMTIKRLRPLVLACADPKGRAERNVARLAAAIDQRVRERGPSKLGRRLRRKGELGMAGAF